MRGGGAHLPLALSDDGFVVEVHRSDPVDPPPQDGALALGNTGVIGVELQCGRFCRALEADRHPPIDDLALCIGDMQGVGVSGSRACLMVVFDADGRLSVDQNLADVLDVPVQNGASVGGQLVALGPEHIGPLRRVAVGFGVACGGTGVAVAVVVARANRRAGRTAPRRRGWHVAQARRRAC